MHTMNSWGRFPTIHMSQRSLQLDTSSVSEVLLLLEPANFLANITSLLLPERRRGGQDADCGRQRPRPVQWHSSQVQMLLFSQCPTPTSPPAPRPLNIWCWTVGVARAKTRWPTATRVKRMLCCIACESSEEGTSFAIHLCSLAVKTKNNICLFSYEVTAAAWLRIKAQIWVKRPHSQRMKTIMSV